MNRQRAIYVALNACFTLLVAVGWATGSSAAHPLFLIPLFALCSSSMLDMRQLNDRYALLVLFSAMYFMSYGIVDVFALFSEPLEKVRDGGVLTMAEAVILVSGAFAQLGYRMVCRPPGPDAVIEATGNDWPERTLVLVGGALWIVCTWLSWEFKVNIIVDATIDATARGLAALGTLKTSAFILAMMLQPLGILMLAYAQCRYRRAYLTPVLITVVLVQLVFGFVIDVKGDALIGGILVVLTKLLVESKLPKGWLVAIVAFIAVAFPVLQANRIVRGDYGIDRTAAAGNMGEVLKRSMTGSETLTAGPGRAAIFFGRVSTKGTVEMIVTRTGRDVPYQYGYTLSPLLTAFIPRVVWPDKPDVQAGQVVNKEFQVSESADTYISPSHLGELYWNLGWPGAVLGMWSIGMLLGLVSRRFHLENAVSLTRIMVAVVTLRLLIIGFESSIAAQYVVWARSMLAIGLLHALFARAPALSGQEKIAGEPVAANDEPLRFPHLMR